MYKLTDIMLQNLEKDLKKFHELFQGGRCQAWQLEELIAKAIRSDFKKSEQVVWKGNGHDIGCDISINNQCEMQIKSGVIKKGFLTLSGHRLTRFKGDLEKITFFLNQNRYLIIAVPYEKKECKLGKTHIYQIIYLQNEFLEVDNFENWVIKKGGTSYFYKNKFGIELTINPSMSWQVWWKVPITNIIEENKTRLIEIN